MHFGAIFSEIEYPLSEKPEWIHLSGNKQLFPILRAGRKGRFGKTTLQQKFVIEWMGFQFVWVILNSTHVSFFLFI